MPTTFKIFLVHVSHAYILATIWYLRGLDILATIWYLRGLHILATIWYLRGLHIIATIWYSRGDNLIMPATLDKCPCSCKPCIHLSYHLVLQRSSHLSYQRNPLSEYKDCPVTSLVPDFFYCACWFGSVLNVCKNTGKVCWCPS